MIVIRIVLYESQNFRPTHQSRSEIQTMRDEAREQEMGREVWHLGRRTGSRLSKKQSLQHTIVTINKHTETNTTRYPQKKVIMLSSASRFAPKVARASSRLTCIYRRSMLTIGEKYANKEKVEEDRYMRAQTEAWKEKLRNLKAAEAHEREEQHFKDVVEPVMGDIEKMLAESGDKVSKEGLETLAKWKIDL